MLKDIFAQLHFIPQAIIISVLLLMAYLFVQDNQGKVRERLRKMIVNDRWLILFLFYVALLFTGTVLGRSHTEPYVDMIGHLGFTKDGELSFVRLENILIFVPYIFLYIKACTPSRPFLNSLKVTIATTFFIELFQLLFWVGQFQFVDLVHNAIGGMTGYFLWYSICWIENMIKKKKHCKQKR